jgi:hypothetical protein
MLMYASLQSQEVALSRDAPLLTLDRASTRPLQRVIVHTDIAESDEPLELPPPYSERRLPIPGLLSSDFLAAGSSFVPSQGNIRPKCQLLEVLILYTFTANILFIARILFVGTRNGSLRLESILSIKSKKTEKSTNMFRQ